MSKKKISEIKFVEKGSESSCLVDEYGMPIPDDPELKRLLHPVIVKSYMVDTDAAFRLTKFVEESIDTGSTGLIVYGRSHAGKTSAINSVVRYLEKKYEGRMAVCKIVFEGEKNYTYGEFYRYLASKLGFPIPRNVKGTTNLADYVISALAQLGYQNSRRVLLFLDEAEALPTKAYSFLKHIQTSLEYPHNIKLITCLIGTKALKNTAQVWENSGETTRQITRRFMQVYHEFKGITSLNELKYALEGYDKLVYEGKTYTQYFFPEAWENGCRMEDLAPDFFKAMRFVSKLQVLPHDLPIGYVTNVAEALLSVFGENGTGWSEDRKWITFEDIVYIMEKQGLDARLENLKFAERDERPERTI